MSDELILDNGQLCCHKDRPLIISGPCSAESEEQVIETALSLSDLGIKIFRAGIWKPRTRPDTFEGLGVKALPWLKRVKKETGMLTATEVANSTHIEEALKHEIDILWIGARTTVNPFAVQNIADALKGVKMPVFIKNPINPDIELWIGALQRINKVGITSLFAVHRGFSYYGDSSYRNPPLWEIPIELKRRIPEIPIITDPSHICGSKKLLFEVSQTAMDLDFDGLFIEAHIDPQNALSDKNQQLKPSELSELLNKLILRNPDIASSKQIECLDGLRRQIDNWDAELIRVLSNRMSVSELIGDLKKKESITILQTNRWSEILDDRLKQARKLGLSEHFVINIFKQIHQESILMQNKIMN